MVKLAVQIINQGDMKNKPLRPDFSEWPLSFGTGLVYGLQGESKPRFIYRGPDFYNLDTKKAYNLSWLQGPHEYCLLSALEFARRYPRHKWSAYWRNHPQFTDEEILAIAKGEKKLVFKGYSYPGQENDDKISFIESRPDFSQEPLKYVWTYSYWLKGDKHGKHRDSMHRPVFARISVETAEERQWVSGDNEYSLIADMEFLRRYPKHEFNKKRKRYFTDEEALEIAKGTKKIKFFNICEEKIME